MIAVIDYGGGNLGSLIAGLERRGAQFVVTDDPVVVDAAHAGILPGDGAFGATIAALTERGLDEAVGLMLTNDKPFLGICIGMQILFESSDEFGDHLGFGVFPGKVTALQGAPRLPHMGWNQLEILRPHPFLSGVRAGDYAYFLHSYRAPIVEQTLAACSYGEQFSAVVARGNIMGTQFHPEKSQHTGALLLDNFVKLAAAA